jgi:hypothetical protein
MSKRRKEISKLMPLIILWLLGAPFLLLVVLFILGVGR